MPIQKRQPGNAKRKRNSWGRGNGSDSMRGELRGGIRLNKKQLNRKVRRQQKQLGADSTPLKNSEYKRICRTGNMVDFT